MCRKIQAILRKFSSEYGLVEFNVNCYHYHNKYGFVVTKKLEYHWKYQQDVEQSKNMQRIFYTCAIIYIYSTIILVQCLLYKLNVIKQLLSVHYYFKPILMNIQITNNVSYLIIAMKNK